MANAGDIKIEIKVDTSKFDSNLKKSERAVKKFTKKTEKGFSSVTKSILKASAALGGFTLIAKAGIGVKNIVTEFTTSARQIDNWSKALGVSTTALQEFASAGSLVGFSFEKTADILKDVNDKIGDFLSTGGGQAKDIFEQLGLNASELANLAPQDILKKINEEANKLGLGSKKKDFLFESIANDASKLIVLFDKNNKKLKEFTEISNKAGAIINPKELKTLLKFDKITRVIALQWKGIKKVFAIGLMPVLTKVAKRIKEAFKSGEINKFASQVADKIKSAFQFLESSMPSIIKGFKTMASTLQSMLPVLTAIPNAFASVGGGYGKYLGYLKSTLEGLGSGPDWLSEMGKPGAVGPKQGGPSSADEIIKQLLKERAAQDKGTGGKQKGFGAWVDAFGTHVQTFREASEASKTAIGQILAGRGKGELSRILGQGPEQAQSIYFDNIVRDIVGSVARGEATKRNTTYAIDMLKQLMSGEEMGGKSVLGMQNVIKELQTFIAAKGKDKEVVKVDVDIALNTPLLEAKIKDTNKTQMAQEAATQGA